TGGVPLGGWHSATVAASDATSVTLSGDDWDAFIPAGGSYTKAGGQSNSGLVLGQSFPCTVIEAN
ncbi:MAG: hypothetical protein RLN74_13540, partial [Ilumatobacter fluminis]